MSVHKDLKTNTWFFRKRIQNIDGSVRNCKRSGFKTKKEALKAEVEFGFDDVKGKITINDLYCYFLQDQKKKIKASHLYNKKIAIEKYILPIFGEKDCNKITINDIRQWQNQLMAAKISVGRINTIHSFFSQMLEYGHLFYNVEKNPVKMIGPLKNNSIKKSTIEVWTKEEFNQFISKVKNPVYNALFNLLYYTGLRIGEALALSFEDVNLETKILIVNKSISFKSNSGKYDVSTPKTMNSNRVINLPSSLIENLNKYFAFLKTNKIKPKNTDFLFGINKPLSKTTIARIKDKACDLAKVKRIRIHDFRHTHASTLILMGLDPIYIKERLGHEDVSTTLNTYSHLFAESRKNIISIIEKI